MSVESTVAQEDFSLSASQLDDKYNPDGGGEHPVYTRDDWRQEVAEENTLRGYWDWVAAQLESAQDDLAEPENERSGVAE